MFAPVAVFVAVFWESESGCRLWAAACRGQDTFAGGSWGVDKPAEAEGGGDASVAWSGMVSGTWLSLPPCERCSMLRSTAGCWGGWLGFGHAVAEVGHGDDVLGALGAVAEFLAEVLDYGA